jgi:REP element-mobilizing transposase RayT
MPQSLARVPLHLIYSTKNRRPFITDAVRDSLHRYQAGILANLGCEPIIINSVEDHIHALFELSRTVTIATVAEEVKKSSSKWAKTQRPKLSEFAWQTGYGTFAVSVSNIDQVRRYIENQREHHRDLSFQDEYREFLRRHNIPFDERYIWD